MTPLKTITAGNAEICPSKIICIGRNYVDHIKELGNEMPDEPVIFLKPNSAIGTRLQSFAGETLHYESEICFMFENNTLSYVGFGLDLTKRKLQTQLKQKGLPWERAKGFDGAALFSSFIPFSGDFSSLSVQLLINKKLVQNATVDLMINKPDEIVNEIVTFMTINDGDILMTGTPKGVGEVRSGDTFSGTILDGGNELVEVCWIAN